MKIYIDEHSLQEKLKAMIRCHSLTEIDLTLAMYTERTEEDRVSFFWFENIMPGKKSTCNLEWISGYLQKTYNVIRLSELYTIYENEKRKLKKDMISKKYPNVTKQNLRGKYIDKDGNVVEIEIREEETEKRASEKMLHEVLKRTYEILGTERI